MAFLVASQRSHRTYHPSDVPKGRPYNPEILTFFDAIIPSGFVPGGSGAGRDRQRIRQNFSGQGPDHVSANSFRFCL